MADMKTASARGKIILSGEYAVLFGKRGIAIPSDQAIDVSWIEDPSLPGITLVWEGHLQDDPWMQYVRTILSSIEPHSGPLHGTFTLNSTLPLGKGMGSSTALLIAACRCLLGPASAKIARTIENALSPDNSGIDFAVIWAEAPTLFQRETLPETFAFDMSLLTGHRLLDTGSPGEPTPDLVAWIRSREAELANPIEVIGECTERLIRGEPIRDVMRDHRRAQIALGIVPPAVQNIITDIEANGGTAKVIGAGGRTGGGGMVLALPPLSEAA